MKVAYLMGTLNRGGTETLLLDTLRQLSKSDLSCLLIHRKTGSLASEFLQTGVLLREEPIRHLFDIGYLYRLRRFLIIQGVSIVHAQMPFDAFLAYCACLGTGIQLILSFHGYDIGYNKLVRSLIYFISRHTTLNIYVSKHLQAYYTSNYLLPSDSKQKVIYNGIDFRKLDRADASSIRQELSIPDQVLLLGSVGNFVSVRDQLTICRFLALLQNKGVDFYFIFVGARDLTAPFLYDECVNFCREQELLKRVHFVGSRSDVPSILKELDVFVYASDHDTFGIAMVEAMSVGVPVFVNDWKVMLEITENGRFAHIYKTKDISDMITKFLSFLDNRILLKKQAESIAIQVREKYSIENHIKNLKEAYNGILLNND